MSRSMTRRRRAGAPFSRALVPACALMLLGSQRATAQSLPGRPCDRGIDFEVPADTVFDQQHGVKGAPKILRYPRIQWPERIRELDPRPTVTVSFVVDTAGRVVRASARVVYESTRVSGDAICASLDQYRFEPPVYDKRRMSVLMGDVTVVVRW